MAAKLDPLELPRPAPAELDPAYYGFDDQDLELSFSCSTISGPCALPLCVIVERMRETYCRNIGVQFMHITDGSVRSWLQQRMESTGNRLELGATQQLRILTKLTDAVIFEEFIQKKYLGAKRFSLEGAESLIPLMQMALDKAAEQGMYGVVIGMPHRGRLNVLANIIGKNPWEIFREFEDAHPEEIQGRGDVKYHLGYNTRWRAGGRSYVLSLCFNPSHLEYVNTVAVGRARANEDRRLDRQHQRGMAILIHGDAAFAGEGIVQETLNLSQLEGYKIGGTLHIIVNNQIGFTTDPQDSRSCDYSSDVALEWALASLTTSAMRVWNSFVSPVCRSSLRRRSLCLANAEIGAPIARAISIAATIASASASKANSSTMARRLRMSPSRSASGIKVVT
jgi:2-oxoglutarate dehydrogenase E1 component